MPRVLRLAAAQMGATNRSDLRAHTLQRMITLLKDAAAQGAQVVLFPELAFTTYPARYVMNSEELEPWFEHGDITEAAQTKPLFDEAKSLGVDIVVGYAEATADGEYFNSCAYYHAKTGSVLSKYRKIHLPGDYEPKEGPDSFQQLEKRYFKVGNLGWQASRVPDISEVCKTRGAVVSYLVPDSFKQTTEEQGEPIFGMMICNDRRWAEAWRVLGLQGAEVVLCGYNTPGYAPDLWGADSTQTPEQAIEMAIFQHKLCMQAHSYTNACFSVSAGRAGYDDGKYSMIPGSCITDPEGRVLVETKTFEDEVIVADCNLDECKPARSKVFDFARHRRVEHYTAVTAQVGVIEPPRLSSPAKAAEKWNENAYKYMG